MKYNAKPMEPYIPWGLAILVGMLVGFLAGYAKRKGENRAIHEDIDKLVDQVRAVTLATREMEAKISNDVWNRQKRWELKRDVLFEAAKRVAEIDEKRSCPSRDLSAWAVPRRHKAIGTSGLRGHGRTSQASRQKGPRFRFPHEKCRCEVIPFVSRPRLV